MSAGEGDDYSDVGPRPDTTGAATQTLAANVAHLARLLYNEAKERDIHGRSTMTKAELQKALSR
ncbi:hypothetical protein [Hamadaea tsunoensis]|uniref:hypothetical protein n=1 Tax=Hamadaea tsunoensis TaxID=53368 RepID=UPI000408F324|nr:hypothetical protein [Hamadaea tsunoensis]